MKSKTSNATSRRSGSLGLAAITSTFTGGSICALLTLLLAGPGLLTQTASAVIAIVDKPATNAAFSYDFTAQGAQTRDELITVSETASTLVVMLGWRNDPGATGVDGWSFSYNGTPLTKAVNVGSIGGTYVGAAIYYLHNPTPGTYTLEGIFTSGTTDRNMAVVSYMTLSGVDTSAAVVVGSDSSTPTGTPVTKSVTGLAVSTFGSLAVANWGIRNANNSEAYQTCTYSANGGLLPGAQVTYGVMPGPPYTHGADDGPYLHSSAGYVPNLTVGTYDVRATGISTDARNGLAVAIFAPVVVTTHTISGTISCSDSADPVGAVVSLKQGGSVVSSLTVPSGGAYSFTVLNGTYTIAASLGFYAPNESSPITVSGGDVTQILTLAKLPTCAVSGKVHDGTNGIGGVMVTATYAGGSASATSSAVDGTYSLNVPATLPVTMSASSIPLSELLVSVPATFTAPNATPITGKDIVLTPNPEYDADLVFSVRSSAIPSAGATWPCAYPPGANLGIFGSPSLATVNGQQMEANRYSSGDGYRLGILSFTTIPCTGAGGASIVAVVQPIYDSSAGAVSHVLSCFYDSLGLDVVATSGLVRGLVNGCWFHGPTIPDGQLSVVSMVVQPDASVMFYVNGTGTPGVYVSGPTVTSYTQITDGGIANYAYGHYIDVGRNDADLTSVYNGNIGDLFLYMTAISDAKRGAQEAALAAKFGISLNGPVPTLLSLTPAGGGMLTVSLSTDKSGKVVTWKTLSLEPPDWKPLQTNTVPGGSTSFTVPLGTEREAFLRLQGQ